MEWQSLIKRHEGFDAKPYCDQCGTRLARFGFGWDCECRFTRQTPGNITIGYGTNLSGAGIDEKSASILMFDRADAIIRDLESFMWFLNLDSVRWAAIVDMAYAMGVPRFREFKQLDLAMALKSYNNASYAILDSEWHGEAKARCEEDAMMIRSGEWPKAGV